MQLKNESYVSRDYEHYVHKLLSPESLYFTFAKLPAVSLTGRSSTNTFVY